MGHSQCINVGAPPGSSVSLQMSGTCPADGRLAVSLKAFSDGHLAVSLFR
jgi:hypothetical protein